MTNAFLELDIHIPVDGFTIEARFEAHQAFTGLFGPSGSGKTSILESIAGLRREAQGSITLAGKVMQDNEKGVWIPPEQRGVGLVAQDALLFPHLTVEQNIRFGQTRAMKSQSKSISVERVMQVLEIESLRNRSISLLSGGEKQRVALARALCCGPEFLLLDEPLGSLDLPLRRRILPYLLRVRDEFSLPMLLVSHDATEVQALCEDLVVLQEGKILAQGPPRTILTDPRVYPIAEHLDFENLIKGKVAGINQGVATIEVTGEQTLRAVVESTDSLHEGMQVLSGIRAEDIILATQKPEGLSARNLLKGTLTSIQREESDAMVTVALSEKGPVFAIKIALPTIEALNLCAGQNLYLIIKSKAIQLITGSLE